MRLSFEVSAPADGEGGVEIEVYLDKAGRDYLVQQLRALNESDEHFHVFSATWFSRGRDTVLSEERRTSGTHIGRHVKVYLRPEGEPLWRA